MVRGVVPSMWMRISLLRGSTCLRAALSDRPTSAVAAPRSPIIVPAAHLTTVPDGTDGSGTSYNPPTGNFGSLLRRGIELPDAVSPAY